jgi:hypothetical protein
MSKKSKDGVVRFVALHHYMLKTSAWLGLSAAARAVYVQIAFRYNGSNNGKIAYSTREAASDCRLNRKTAGRAFKELVEAGFTEETRHGTLSRKTRVASQWRMTAYKCDLTGSLSSNLFMTRLAQTRAASGPKEVPAWPKIGPAETPNWPKRGPGNGVSGPLPGPNEGPHIIYQGSSPPDARADERPAGRAAKGPSLSVVRPSGRGMDRKEVSASPAAKISSKKGDER